MKRICGALWFMIVLGVAAGTQTQAAEKPILVLDAGGHTASVKKVLFSRDGTELVSVSQDKTIRVWDLATGEPLRVLRSPIGKGKEGELHAAALAPDGITLAVGGVPESSGRDGYPIYLFSLSTGRIERVLIGHENPIHGLSFDAEGRRLISGSGDQTARIWNVGTGKTEQVLKGHAKAIYGVTFSPDGRRCATASYDKTAAVWSVATGERLATLNGHTAEVFCLAWSRDDQTLATGSFDHTIRLWRVEDVSPPSGSTGKSGTTKNLEDLRPPLASFKTFDKLGEDNISSVTFTADGQRLLYAHGFGMSEKITVSLLDITTGRELARFDQHANSITDSTLSPDGSLAASGDNNGEIFLWKVADGKLVHKLVGRGRIPWAAAWSADVLGAAPANANRARIAWGNTNRGSGQQNMKTPLERTFDLASLEFGPAPDDRFDRARPERGSLSLVAGQANQVGLVSSVLVRQGNRTLITLEMAFPGEWIRSFTLLPNDRAAVGTELGLRLYDARAGKQVSEFHGHTGTIWAVSPSPDGKYLLSAANDMTLRVWDPVALGKSRTPREAFPKDWVEAAQANPTFAKLLDREDGFERIRDEFKKLNRPKELVAQLDALAADAVFPLLSLFFAGDDWIAWTPEGYYAASPGGEKLMGWHVNNGREQMASFYPASQFRSTLYRPDVIKLLLKTGSVERALELADQARGRMTQKTEVAEVLPPVVRITSPRRAGDVSPPSSAGSGGEKTLDEKTLGGLTSPARRDGERAIHIQRAELEISAVATSRGKHPVTALSLLIDGRPHQGQAGVKSISAPQLGDATVSWRVSLSPGKHRLHVLADSSVSQGASDEVEVAYVGDNSLDAVELPVLYVFAVGISAYSGDLKLDYAAKDAEALVATFQSKSKPLFRKIEVKTLTDKQATRAEILKGLGWLRKEVTQRDYAVFSFSGHGRKDADGGLYFLPVDVDADNLSSTAILADQFKLPLTALPGKVIMLLDACHSGGVDAGSTGRRKGAGELTDDLVRDLVTDESGVVMMCSSTGRESSLENNDAQQGNFTLAIVEGLSGKADYNKDGHVYLNELDTYVTDRVKELTRGQQHPVTAKPSSIRSFPLAKP